MRLTHREEAKVRRAMNETFNKLKTVESEIARLRDRLIILNQRKNDTEQFIKVHQGLLSPIRRLHPEILQETFCRCLPVAHNSVLSFKEAPLLLGRVCSQWRRIAYSTPALWFSLHVVLTPLAHAGAEARLETINAWLSRSGILPLSISMSALTVYTSMDCRTSMTEFQPYFILVAKHTRRWKSIHYLAEFWDPMWFLMEIKADDLPLLEVFHIKGGRATTSPYSKKGSILSAPLLRDLSVHPYAMRLLDLPVDWNNLTSFHSHSLIYPPYDSWPKVVLSKLRTLSINEMDPIHSDNLLAVINNLYAPALRHFSCQLSSWFPPNFAFHPLPGQLSALEVFSTFFQRLNEPLEELSLCAFSGKMSHLMKLLYIFPGLKRLSEDCPFYFADSDSTNFPKELFNDHLLLAFIPYERRSHCHLCSLAEEIEAERVELDDSVLASSTCLCPNLQVLNVIGAGCSKHILLEFLNSRLVDHDKYDIARLRRFMILSNEPRLEDDNMKEDINRLTEKSGSLVKLEHLLAPTSIFPPPPRSPDPLFKSYLYFDYSEPIF